MSPAPRRPAPTHQARPPFWLQTPGALGSSLGCGVDGLSAAQAAARLTRHGPNADRPPRRASLARALARRLLEPLSLILTAAGVVSAVTGDLTGGAIIVAILGLSIGLDTFQEGHANRAAEALRRSVALKAEVKRDGKFASIPVEEVVPGDVVRVRAGDVVPADALVLTSTAFTANEALIWVKRLPVRRL